MRSNNTYKQARDDSLWKNKNKIWNRIFSVKAWFTRKSSLKIYEVYLNMALSGLGRIK